MPHGFTEEEADALAPLAAALPTSSRDDFLRIVAKCDDFLRTVANKLFAAYSVTGPGSLQTGSRRLASQARVSR
jgi:hypothetical protein